MRVNVSEIVKTEGAGVDVFFVEDLPEIRNFDTLVKFESPFKFTGRIVNLGGLLKLSGELHFEFSADCLRCLSRVNTVMDLTVEENFVKALESADDDAYTYEGNVVDIDKPLMDNVILALPMKVICSEDCKGLCNVCGANLNLKNCNCDEHKIVDSRMEILKDYFK